MIMTTATRKARKVNTMLTTTTQAGTTIVIVTGRARRQNFDWRLGSPWP
jgi:hypothetical protein